VFLWIVTHLNLSSKIVAKKCITTLLGKTNAGNFPYFVKINFLKDDEYVFALQKGGFCDAKVPV
jgi:hypothetical protein